ncbi:hypothetical protein PG985_014002 [Apiospora marii]|uniref:Uncharacterized protein n=1 Tax=Apiospora marii TaxID=335849 RepID=A0ABR1R669_9PEZI
MTQPTHLQSQRDALRKTILWAVYGALTLALLLFVIGSNASPEADLDVNRLLVTVFASGFLWAWCFVILLALSFRIPDRFPYCMAAGSIVVMGDVIVFIREPIPFAAIVPLVLFFSFWVSFTMEYLIGSIYRSINWCAERALPETDPRGDMVDGQSQSGSPSAKAVPLTTVDRKGQSREVFEKAWIAAGLSLRNSSTPKPV